MKYRGKSCGKKYQDGGRRHGYAQSVSDDLRLPTTVNPNPKGMVISNAKEMGWEQAPDFSNALTDTGLLMDRFSNMAGFLSGISDRKKQNQYDYQQQALLGQMNAMPANDYQPNPYSLYARYGGKLKHYMMHDMGFSNKAHMGKGDETMYGEMQQGGVPSSQMTNDFQFAQDFAARHNMAPNTNLHDAGYKPKFVDGQGNPFVSPTGAPSSFNVASGIQLNDFYQTSEGKFGYDNPQTGDFTAVDPSVVNMKRFQNPNSVVQEDRAMRSFVANAKFGKGGKWLQDAVNPAHKGYCTPLNKSTCTGHRKQFALMMKKKHGFQ